MTTSKVPASTMAAHPRAMPALASPPPGSPPSLRLSRLLATKPKMIPTIAAGKKRSPPALHQIEATAIRSFLPDGCSDSLPIGSSSERGRCTPSLETVGHARAVVAASPDGRSPSPCFALSHSMDPLSSDDDAVTRSDRLPSDLLKDGSRTGNAVRLRPVSGRGSGGRPPRGRMGIGGALWTHCWT